MLPNMNSGRYVVAENQSHSIAIEATKRSPIKIRALWPVTSTSSGLADRTPEEGAANADQARKE